MEDFEESIKSIFDNFCLQENKTQKRWKKLKKDNRKLKISCKNI